jgi:hypothetical protein
LKIKVVEESVGQVLVVPRARDSLYHRSQDRVVGVTVRPPLPRAVERRLTSNHVDELEEFEAACVPRIDVLKLGKVVPCWEP